MENKLDVLIELLNNESKHGKFYSKLEICNSNYNRDAFMIVLEMWYEDYRYKGKKLNTLQMKYEYPSNSDIKKLLSEVYNQFTKDVFRHIIFAETNRPNLSFIEEHNGIYFTMISYPELLKNGYTIKVE